MSKEIVDSEEQDLPLKYKMSKKKKIIISLIVFLIIGFGCGAFIFLKNGLTVSGLISEYKQDKKLKAAREDEARPPISVALEIFTVNLQPQEQEKYLQVSVSLKFKDPKEAEEVKAYIPEIRNAVLIILGGETASSLQDSAGKEKLRKDVYKAVKEILPNHGYESFKDVLFTSFVIQ